MHSTPDLSIVIPLQNEQENVRPLYRALLETLEPLGRSFEILLINDGSTDGTAALLDELAETDLRVVPLHFTRNFGQAAALSAGFEAARGGRIITMDGDLQNDPADIPRLLELLESGGYRVVSGWRRRRAERAVTRRLPSQVANRLIALVTGLPSRDNGCSLKCYRAEVVKGVCLPAGYHRYLPAILGVRPEEFAQVDVGHRPRNAGRSHYGIARLFSVLATLPALPAIKAGAESGLRWVRAAARVACGFIAAAALALVTRHWGLGFWLGIAGLLFSLGTSVMEAQLSEWLAAHRKRPFEIRTHAAAARTGPDRGPADSTQELPAGTGRSAGT